MSGWPFRPSQYWFHKGYGPRTGPGGRVRGSVGPEDEVRGGRAHVRMPTTACGPALLLGRVSTGCTRAGTRVRYPGRAHARVPYLPVLLGLRPRIPRTTVLGTEVVRPRYRTLVSDSCPYIYLFTSCLGTGCLGEGLVEASRGEVEASPSRGQNDRDEDEPGLRRGREEDQTWPRPWPGPASASGLGLTLPGPINQLIGN